jgi:hypothetical protein
MKAFQLHEDTGDKEAAKKTDDLHAFLHPVCNGDTPHDFEGGNHGLSVYFTINVGDTMVIGSDGGFRVLPKDQPVRITRAAFMRVYEAMLAVEHDNGAHHVNRIVGAGTINLEEFEMPYSYGVTKLCVAEVALDALHVYCSEYVANGIEVVYDTIILGEEGEQDDLIKKHSKRFPGLVTAHQLINDWFNSWQKGE